MIAGRPPFKAASEYLIFQSIIALRYTFPPDFPADARDLILRMLVLDPAARPSVDEIKAHPFFHAIDWDTLWTVEPPPIRTGLAPPRPPQMQPTFELLAPVMSNDGDDADAESENAAPSIAALGVSPATTETVHPVSGRRSYTSGSSDEMDTGLRQRASGAWSSVLLPGEVPVLRAPIIDRTLATSAGLFAAVGKPRLRTLVLTDFPRLLLVNDSKAGHVKLKTEVAIAAPPPPRTGPSTGVRGPERLVTVNLLDPKSFRVVTVRRCGDGRADAADAQDVSLRGSGQGRCELGRGPAQGPRAGHARLIVRRSPLSSSIPPHIHASTIIAMSSTHLSLSRSLVRLRS